MLKRQTNAITRRKRKEKFKKSLKSTLYACTIIVSILTAGMGFNLLYSLIFTGGRADIKTQQQNPGLETDESSVYPRLTTAEIRKFLENKELLNSEEKIFTTTLKDKTYTVTTSFNLSLQKFLVKKLERLKKLTRGKPRRIAMVVMEPDSGKILSLAGFDLLHPGTNPCFNGNFPAASIFKIITASAAVEELGFKADTQLYFNGNKYTLYKNQLKNIKNKYTSKISFAKAFAESVNPVFGKIGKNRLKNEILEKYVKRFGFNKDIDSELKYGPNRIEITDNPYEWAEIGCGFNNSTTISPLYGAVLASCIINDGKKATPSIVEKIVDSKNEIIYDNRAEKADTIITKKTASIVQTLMHKTIEKGTARKAFRGYRKDKVLSRLVIGGKTGSIYNKKHTVKYDWFTGFAKRKTWKKDEKNDMIAISIVVGHGDYIGTRACKYGKMIIKEYYKNI